MQIDEDVSSEMLVLQKQCRTTQVFCRPGGMREPSLETLVSLIRLYKAYLDKT